MCYWEGFANVSCEDCNINAVEKRNNNALTIYFHELERREEGSTPFFVCPKYGYNGRALHMTWYLVSVCVSEYTGFSSIIES